MDKLNKKSKILFLLDNPFTNDRRVLRESKTLVENGFDVVLLATKKNECKDFEVIDRVQVYRIFDNDIFDPKKGSCFNRYATKIISDYRFDIIHANDQTMLHLGVKIKKRLKQVKLVYDSHELFRAWPLNTDASGLVYIKSLIVRFLLKRREVRNIRYIDRLITVNESIREDMLYFHHLSCPSISLRNIPDLPIAQFKKRVLRDKFNLSDSAKILVYIGANIYPKTINIEQVIREFSNRENVNMVFICSFNWGYKAIKEYADSIGVRNLLFHDLISADDIADYLHDADAGIVSGWNRKDLSYWYGLDNKLFEYMMSEIPIVATEQPEYINIVRNYNLGICINPEKESYYDAFEEVVKNREHYVQQIKKAKKELNWHKESQKLVSFYNNIL